MNHAVKNVSTKPNNKIHLLTIFLILALSITACTSNVAGSTQIINNDSQSSTEISNNTSASPSPMSAIGVISLPEVREYPQADGYNLGDPNAPVKVVKYSNFYCSHCKNFAQEDEADFINDYVLTGKVYYTEIGFSRTQEARLAIEASLCANSQSKFWEYRDLIYANISNDSIGALDVDNLVKLAQTLSIDIEKFRTCLETGEFSQKAQEDYDYGKSIGIKGTPMFVVNGSIFYAGELSEAIEAELTK